ncbi:Not1-domain-containing protein [Bimuria novae-zelandiae CBS 107.79]|uniref:General negative regulator of transcription subunit 1 n=1 Tax=Bimuria novae-zelandiae CBS 107.79 TaxID=1447943 RepID=A0A6A5UV52_9PLEO|nr:Not1-domain-containing protein [Bimuria novae-zelandiae CBS 107.79]
MSSNQTPWGPPRHHQSARLTPISTAINYEQHRNTPSPSASRPANSPATSSFPSLPASASRASSSSSSFSPSHTGQQPPAGQLLSFRARTITSQQPSQLASAAAASGGASSSGGGPPRLVRASPSLSTSSTVGSPSTSTNPAGTSAHNQNLSRIVIAQVFLLLSQFGPVKDEKDRAKWETQVEQIRKLVDSNGMEVFSKYFRRLLRDNAVYIFMGGGRSTEANGNYQILVTEVQKLRTDPDQALKIAEALHSPEGDLFRDFDLATFVAHFQLDVFSQAMLAAACKLGSNSELKARADTVLGAITDELVLTIAQPDPSQLPDSPTYLAALVTRILQAPPSDWTEDSTSKLIAALSYRYQHLGARGMPVEVEAALQLVELSNASQNPLVKLVQRAGPRATESVESCKETLAAAEARDISYQQVANVLVFMSVSSGYNAKNFVAALREHRTGQRIEWQEVVHAFDRDTLRVSKAQFLSIYHALLPVAQESEAFDIQLLWGGVWQKEVTQLSFLTRFLECTAEELDVTQIPRLRQSYSLEMFENASPVVKEFAKQAVKHPYVSLDATRALFSMIFRSAESYADAQMLQIPNTVINPHTAEFLVAAAAVPKPWGALQEQALKQLFDPYFRRQLDKYEFVIYGLWQQDPQWLIERFNDAYNIEKMSLTLVLQHAQEHGWLDQLIHSNTEITLDLAAQAHAQGLFQLEPWLQHTSQQAPAGFSNALQRFLDFKANEEMQRSRDDGHMATSLPLQVKTVYSMLWFLADCGLTDEVLMTLQRVCIQAYPRLINYGEGVDDIIDANGQNGNALPEEADKKMQEHFKNMYSSESDVREIITVLKKYKESRDPAEQDLFACMIHGLFDEYNCFGEYPLEALATTAVLFGGIINYNLLSRLALRVGLSMVLEAVQDYRPDDSMYKFGLQALIHYSPRLHEWPNYCEELLNIPGLQGTEIYTKAEEVVRSQIGEVNGSGQNGVGLTNGNHVDEQLQAEPAVPKFTCLHVDPPLRPDLYEEPDEEVQDRVLFVLNNVSERNLHEKMRDLTQAVEDRHHQWFANYLVEERAKMQPNFQQLYLDMLDLFNDRVLWAEVLRETYVIVIAMLNSEGSLGTTERGHLKNLGGWLGSLTIARNQPIKFRNISFKDLLIEGFATDRLLLVIPFTCKVLAQAAKSVIFQPPNPWLMEILSVLKELYEHAELKLNQKFEIEVLCKGLNIDPKDIEPSTCIRMRPQVEEEYMGQMPAPDGLEPFGDMGGLLGLQRARGPSERFSSAVITAALPDFRPQLQYPPSNASAAHQNAAKKIFETAVQQAIQEIIAPVVERSVTIAAISTSQLVSKDFALEPDEEKLRNAAYTVVKSLSGALALVTCKEPLRMSIQNNIRVMARELPEQAIPEGHVVMFVNDNLELVCSTVEQAAEVSSRTEIDQQIQDAIQARQEYRQQRINEPFKDAAISPWAFYIPEPYKQTTGGLNREQLAIYEEFGRQSRGAPHANNVSQDSGRQLPDVLQDQFATVTNMPTPAAAPVEPRPSGQQSRLQGLQTSHAPPTQQINGFMESGALDRGWRGVEDLLGDMMRQVKEAQEERISDLQPTNPVHHTFEQLLSSIAFAGPNKEAWAFRIAGQVTNHLFSDNLSRLEIETLGHLLSSLCEMSVSTSRQVLMWLATLNDDDRILNATVMIALMEVGLMDMHKLNGILAKAIQDRRVAALEMLSSLMDEILLNEHPSALRADFALSIDALTNWLAEDPNLEIGKALLTKLRIDVSEQEPTPPSTGQKDQLEYIFDEWVHLQHPDTPKKSITAFIYQLHVQQIIKSPKESIEFFRACIDASVASYGHEQSLPYGHGNPDTATVKVDALARLIVDLVVYQGEQNGAVKESKAKYLDQILLVVILVLNNYLGRGDTPGPHGDHELFCQKVFFRLFSSLLFELNDAAKEHFFAGFRTDMFLAVAKAFLILQPTYFPRFAFSWLTLISHRIFVPAMLEDESSQGWELFARLMEALLVFTGQIVRPQQETIMAQTFYRGVLRVLLVVHHDYPEFLAENHFRFCNSIPMHCTQLRNLVVSAYPSNILEMPDPFTTGIKVDRLDDSRQAPTIRADLDRTLHEAKVKDLLDGILRSPEPSAQDVEQLCKAVYYSEPKPAGFEADVTTADPALIHAITLYIGTSALALQGMKGPIFDGSAPAAKLIEKLARELRPEARFHFISAIANQLRWPNSHTQYFSCALLHLFSTDYEDVKHTITRVFMERLLVHRPHPWGLIITLLEILKNRTYAFWDLPFVKAAPEVERIFSALFTNAQQSPQPLA